MSIQYLAAIIFVIILTLFLILKRKKIVLQKILFFPLLYFVMYKTKFGLKFMERFAKKFSKPLKYIGYFAIFIGFLGMILITFALIKNIYTLLTIPGAPPGVAPVLPFKAKGVFYVPFDYWIISIFIIALVHEFSHGILARKYNIRIKSSGMAFLGIILPIIPAAFVEPDEKELRKKSAREQLSVFAAGPFSNILLAFVIFGVILFIVPPIVNIIMPSEGILITGTVENLSAANAGIEENELMLKINNQSTRYIKELGGLLSDKKPGDTINIQTNKSNYDIILSENPEKKNEAYMGVYIEEKRERNQNFEEKYGKFTSEAIIWFMGLLFLLYVLNLGIGLFNLAPMGPLDGGRILLVTLQQFMKEEKAVRLWKNIGFFFLALVLINLLFAFIR